MHFNYTRDELIQEMYFIPNLSKLIRKEEEEVDNLDNLNEAEINAKVKKIIKNQRHRRIISKCILVFTIIICLFLMLLLSANFGEELSIAWMKCCLIAFVHDTLLAQTLKTSLVY